MDIVMDRRRTLLALVAAVFLAALSFSGCGDQEEYVRPTGEGPWVLVDVYHTTKQNPVDYRMDANEFGYQGVFAFWRAFEHLERNHYKWTSIHTQPFSKERLEGFDTVFINLVSSDRPDFTDKEIEAIIDYVKNGGGLFVIADHTNVYDHADRVNRFLKPMGVEVLYHIATDVPPRYSVSGTAWIMARDFKEHPVTRNVDMISLQTGGPVRSDDSGVAFTSTCESAPPRGCSFADLWDPEDPGGYYGDWTWNGDLEEEPIGPLEVVSAHEYGEGRIVVVGDQNIFGDSWLHFGNNFELFMNAMDWTAGKTVKPEYEANDWLADRKPFGLNIAIPADEQDHAIGKAADSGLFSFYVSANRDLEVTASGVEKLDDTDDVVMVVDIVEPFGSEEIETMRGYLDDGKRVVVVFDSETIQPATAQLLAELAPDFTLDAGGVTHAVTDESFTTANVPKITGIQPMRSDYLKFAKARDCPETGECIGSDRIATWSNLNSEPYMLDVASNWGEPFLTAGNTDVARIKKVGKGELIIFIQSRFFRGSTMGQYLTPPADQAPHRKCEKCNTTGLRSIHHLQFSLHDYLQTPVNEDEADE